MADRSKSRKRRIISAAIVGIAGAFVGYIAWVIGFFYSPLAILICPGGIAAIALDQLPDGRPTVLTHILVFGFSAVVWFAIALLLIGVASHFLERARRE